MAKRQRFSTHFTTILVMIGVSVGLGNVWRCPYMMGKYGGSAFLFIYLLFTLLFAIPAVMAEWSLGRQTRKGTIGAFSDALGRGLGKPIGLLLFITVLVANSYYIVVIANVVFSGFYSAVYGFSAENLNNYQTLLNNGWLQFAIAITTLLAALYVIYRGLNKGIEAVSKIFVPFFLLAMIYLVISAFSLDGATAKFAAFLRPDFAAMKAEHIFAALGQTFFSLGLGGTFLVIYGSYLQDNESLPKSALLTGAGDVGAAVLASLFIVPSVLVFGLDLASGPGLIFSTLPRLFMVMPLGRILGTLFLLALVMVAFLSAVAALEVLVGSVNDGVKTPWSRKKSVIVLGIAETILIFPSALDPSLIGVLDLIFGSGMQTLGSALAIIALCWGFGKSITLRQIFEKESGNELFFLWLRWVIPGVLFAILIIYIYNSVV